MAKLLALPVAALALVALFALWYYDPSAQLERAARAERQAQLELLRAEQDAALAPVYATAKAVIVIAVALSAAVGVGYGTYLALLSARRQVYTWHPDRQGVIPLTDAQQVEAAVTLLLERQRTLQIAASVEAERPARPALPLLTRD